jgi:TetR/AcrR family transcriptional regulator, regulator of cefoperazone and chloramphenicol sensitivity
MARAAKHRHATEGGYARGEETRARIVTAAMRMFGERGFEAASTRDIATMAGVNAPALQYYFDNKEGVYLACVEYIVASVWDFLSEVAADAEQALEAQASDAELIEKFCALQGKLAEFMFTIKDSEEWRLFMARLNSGEGPPAGFQFIYQHVSGRMTRVLAGIIGRLLGRPADDEETLIRTMTVSGQLHVFSVARKSVLARLNWDRVDAARLERLKRILREHSIVLMQAMVKARDSAGRAHGRRPVARVKRKRVVRATGAA